MGGADASWTPTDGPMLVLGIGASAGGLEPLGALLESLATVPAAVVVLMHLAPEQPSRLTELLRSRSSMPAVVVEDGMPLVEGRVHVAPPGAELEVSGGRLRTLPRPEGVRVPAPIDRLFRSMAAELGERAVAVVVSGTGADGAEGLRAIKQAGGMTLVQAPDEARFDGMPRSALKVGGVERALPISRLAHAIVQWIGVWHAQQPAVLADERPSATDPFEAIVAYAGATVRRDMRVYKSSTVRRRILRRMALLGIDAPEDYLLRLGADPEESRRLAEQLLVQVTRFFRDRDAFDALGRALAEAAAGEPSRDEFRAWVAGCSTGEEAYSIAMLLAERFGETGFRVFASDLSADAIEQARSGRFSDTAIDAIPDALRARWFVRVEGTWQVRSSLRHRVTFAHHDMIFDPPFSRMDLVSCRNLLIYLEAAAQLKIFQLMHFALRPEGLLFLGSAENPPATASTLFEAVDRLHRIFRRCPVSSRRPLALALTADRWGSARQPPPSESHRSFIERIILDRVVEAAALVDGDLKVVYTHGGIERYLRYPRGSAISGLSGALSPAGGARVRVAIRAALDREVDETTLEIPGHGEERVQVRIIAVEDDDRVLLTFAPAPERGTPTLHDDSAMAAEFQRFEMRLDQLVEQLQTSNEELRASHEELLSMNEELQSSNEELETSKEELQSLNEELTTMNAELQAKLGELEEANADLSNFLTASRIPAIFLDDGLCIRRFTPETRRVFRLAAADLGRPLSDIRHELRDVDLDGLLNEVLRSGAPVERELAAADGRWWHVRVMPYRVKDDSICAGIVLTLGEVTEQRRRTQQAEAYRDRLRFSLEGTPITAFTQDAELRYVEVINALGVATRSFVGVSDDALDFGPQGDALRAFKRRVIETGEDDRGRFEVVLPETGERRVFDLRARRDPGDATRLIATSIDVTDAVAEQAETERRIRRELSTSYLESLGLLAGGVAHDFNNHLMVMQGVIELIRDDASDDDAELMEDFDRALHASRALIGQILAFVQSDAATDETVSVSDVVRRSVELLAPIVPDGIRIMLDLADTADVVTGAFTQIQQVVTNLTHNAIHAMPAGGMVRIAVAVDGPWIVLEVRDEGIGIEPERLGRIFEPFYTTGERSARSGMGLAVVHGVVRSLGGAIDVESEVGVGSRFFVRLPCSGGAPAEQPTGAPEPRRSARGERIAVVDDEPDVARVIERVLRRRGLVVFRFDSGERLLEAMAGGARFDALVCDVLMPGLDGPETVARARRMMPGLPAVLLSGYRGERRPEHGDPMLDKPVSGDELVEALLIRMGR